MHSYIFTFILMKPHPTGHLRLGLALLRLNLVYSVLNQKSQSESYFGPSISVRKNINKH